MAGTMKTTPSSFTATQHLPPTTPLPPRKAYPSNMTLQSYSGNGVRKPNLAVRTFSPVNENGCFEFDRVLKSGNVSKRTRKTKSWKPIHLVLRPNTLSFYADTDGTKLRHQIQLSDITAVARQRDPKKKAKHVFALFSPSRNYHIEAASETDAQQWVEMIRSEARIEQEEEETMALMSPTVGSAPGEDSGFFERNAVKVPFGGHTAGSTSASEVESTSLPLQIRKNRSRNPIITSPETLHSATRKPSLTVHNLSGAEQASYSDFSDAPPYPDSTLSLSLPSQTQIDREKGLDAIYRPSTSARPGVQRQTSAVSTTHHDDPTAAAERVVYNGYLYLLKQRGGVRQWKTVWAVLRAKSLALYKNEEEYQPLLIVNFSSIVDAVDIDNLSKSKRHCFEVITEDRLWKFCARSEEEVAKWVGGFKALLAKRREGEKHKTEERREMERAGDAGKGKERVGVGGGSGEEGASGDRARGR